MNAQDLIALADRLKGHARGLRMVNEHIAATLEEIASAALRTCAADREKIESLRSICRHVSHWLDKEAPDDFGILIGMLDDAAREGETK